MRYKSSRKVHAGDYAGSQCNTTLKWEGSETLPRPSRACQFLIFTRMLIIFPILQMSKLRLSHASKLGKFTEQLLNEDFVTESSNLMILRKQMIRSKLIKEEGGCVHPKIPMKFSEEYKEG